MSLMDSINPYLNSKKTFMEIEGETYLLDTSIALWLLLGSDKLPEKAFRDRFKPQVSRFVFHQASIWEIQIKYDLGKLPLPQRPGAWILEAVMKSGLQYERIDDGAIFYLGKLPQVHRDPFDRLLVAHALVNNWILISSDRLLEGYPVNVEIV